MKPKGTNHKIKGTIHKILLALVLLALAAWGTSCTSSTQEPTQQQATQQQATQQQTTQQETQQQEPTQQEPTQQSPSTPSSTDLAAQFVGTWEKTSFQGNPVPPGTQVLTFSNDGTLQSSTSDGSEDWTAQYSVLDESHIRFTFQDGRSYVANYSRDGDVVTIRAADQTGTFQRTRVD